MISQIELLVILFAIFQLKHFICDFPLQFPYMYIKKCSPNWDFVIPLASHAGIHAVSTLIICAAVNINLWWLAVIDFIIHFLLDRLKSGQKYLGRYNDQTKNSFWNVLGFDQMAHHLTHIALTYCLVML